MGPRCCLLLLLLFLVPAARTQCTNVGQCVLDCSGCDPGFMLADPADCSRYYECDTSTLIFDESSPCDAGEVFNQAAQRCDTAALCTTCPTVCNYDCRSNHVINQRIAYLSDCSSYYDCTTGDVTTCPSSAPYFDGITCQMNESLCCSCQPYCYLRNHGELVPDPYDCRRYYACVADWVVPTASNTCLLGQYFDAKLGDCSAEASCVTQCKNVIGSDGCIDPYTCEATGYFAKCPNNCTAEYYHCTTVSDTYVEAESCQASYVFHPDTNSCVSEDQCP